MLGQASIDATTDVDLGPRRGLAGWGNAHELTGHRAGRLEAMNDLVATRSRSLDRVVKIRERGLESHQALLQAFARRGHARLGGVVDEVGRHQLVHEAEVAVVEDFERDPLGGQLDVCGHEWSHPSCVRTAVAGPELNSSSAPTGCEFPRRLVACVLVRNSSKCMVRYEVCQPTA